MFLINHNFLRYERRPNEVPFFSWVSLSGDPAEGWIEQIMGESSVLSIFEIDDTILNPLEEVASMAFARSISFDDVYAFLGNTILSTVQNEAIQQHIQETRRHRAGANAWRQVERIVPRLDRLELRFSRAAART